MWVKVCGLTDPANAVAVAECGVDAIGLNFYRKSKRFVSEDDAYEIVRALPNSVRVYGLFVNETPENILETCLRVGLTWVQLHGDEPPSFANRLTATHVLRAVRVAPGTLSKRLTDAAKSGAEEFLLDADVAAFGGSGRSIDWHEVSFRPDVGRPVYLAGGLTPDNIGDAVRTARPDGVDVASGVESAPGIKDVDRVRRFVDNARRAG